jgi:hypothetical protein
MNVRELIAALQKCPPDMDVCIDDGEGDYGPVVQVLHEDAVTYIQLLTTEVVVHPVHPYGSCGSVCGLCGDQP